MSENYPQFSGVFIPREVLLDNDVPASGKLIFAIIQSLDNDNGCYASNEYIGGMVGLSESSVRAAIHVLEQKGYVSRVITEGTQRTLRTCVTQSFRADTRQNSGTHPPENQRLPRQKTGTYRSRKNKVVDISSLLLEPLPHGEDFAKAWNLWKEYRQQTKKPLTAISIREQLRFLSSLDEHVAIKSIEESIRNGWSGIFASRSQSSQEKPRLLTSKDHDTF